MQILPVSFFILSFGIPTLAILSAAHTSTTGLPFAHLATRERQLVLGKQLQNGLVRLFRQLALSRAIQWTFVGDDLPHPALEYSVHDER